MKPCALRAQIRARAAGLLKRFPLAACSPDVQAAAEAARSARRCRAGRKRFGGRYTAGNAFWDSCNGRAGAAPHATPRAARFPDAGVFRPAGVAPFFSLSRSADGHVESHRWAVEPEYCSVPIVMTCLPFCNALNAIYICIADVPDVA